MGMQDRIQNIAKKKKKGKGEEEGKEVDDATGVEVEDIQEDEEKDEKEEEEGAETSLPPANGEVRKRRSRRAPMAKPERDEVAFIDEGAAEEDGRAAGEDRTATGVETAVTGYLRRSSSKFCTRSKKKYDSDIFPCIQYIQCNTIFFATAGTSAQDAAQPQGEAVGAEGEAGAGAEQPGSGKRTSAGYKWRTRPSQRKNKLARGGEDSLKEFWSAVIRFVLQERVFET